MREILARIICAFVVCVVVAFSALFAWKHNPPLPSDAERGTPPRPRAADAPGDAARGPKVYAEQNCATCHSIAGVGNPRHPLEGIGARSAEELRQWITATGSAEGKLPHSVVRRKSRYRELPAEDLDALVGYLLALHPRK